MATTLRVLVGLRADDNSFPMLGGNEVEVAQVGTGGGNPGKVIATVAGNVIDFGALVDVGYCYMVNNDPTNFVKFGPESGGVIVPCNRLSPGQRPTLIELLPGVTYRVEANTADCEIQIHAAAA